MSLITTPSPQISETELLEAEFPVACNETRGGTVVVADMKVLGPTRVYSFVTSSGSPLGLTVMAPDTELEAEIIGHDFIARSEEADTISEVAMRPQAVRVRQLASSYQPGIVSVSEDGDELIVASPDKTKNLLLPESLWDSTVLGADYTERGLLVALLPLDPVNPEISLLTRKYRAQLFLVKDAALTRIGSFSTANYGPVQFTADGETALHLKHSSHQGRLTCEISAISDHALVTLRRFDLLEAERLRLLHYRSDGRFMAAATAFGKTQRIGVYDVENIEAPVVFEAQVEKRLTMLRLVGERSLVLGVPGSVSMIRF